MSWENLLRSIIYNKSSIVNNIIVDLIWDKTFRICSLNCYIKNRYIQ